MFAEIVPVPARDCSALLRGSVVSWSSLFSSLGPLVVTWKRFLFLYCVTRIGWYCSESMFHKIIIFNQTGWRVMVIGARSTALVTKLRRGWLCSVFCLCCVFLFHPVPQVRMSTETRAICSSVFLPRANLRGAEWSSICHQVVQFIHETWCRLDIGKVVGHLKVGSLSFHVNFIYMFDFWNACVSMHSSDYGSFDKKIFTFTPDVSLLLYDDSSGDRYSSQSGLIDVVCLVIECILFQVTRSCCPSHRSRRQCPLIQSHETDERFQWWISNRTSGRTCNFRKFLQHRSNLHGLSRRWRSTRHRMTPPTTTLDWGVVIVKASVQMTLSLTDTSLHPTSLMGPSL